MTLHNEFESLAALPESADPAQKRRRGRRFEEFLRNLLAADDLAPRIRIRPDGEEIDGSFVLNDRTFLLEAKWHAAPLPASSIYQFKGKVDGKLVGTLGVFISMSGFSEDAVDALTVGKDLNVILFDGSDVEAAVDSPNGFRTVLLAKLRAAGEEGLVYFAFRSSLATPDSSEVMLREEAGRPAPQDVIVVAEGHADRAVLAELTRRIIQQEGLSISARFLVAGGKQSIAPLANLARKLSSSQSSLIVVADTDGDRHGTEERLCTVLQDRRATLVLIEPELEAWLFPEAEKARAALAENAQREGENPVSYATRVARILPLEELRMANRDFAVFYDAIVGADTGKG